MAAPELRPMGIGDILDVTFRLYRQRFLTFLLIALVVYVPYALLIAAFQPFGMVSEPVLPQEGMANQGQVRVMFPSGGPATAAAVLGVIGSAVFLIVLFPLCSAALVQNISASYLGEELTAGQSYARAAPGLMGLIGTYLLIGLIIMLVFLPVPFAMLISPLLLLILMPIALIVGVILSLWLLLITPVVVLERRVGVSAMRRSRELMRGNYGKGIGLGFLVGILTSIIVYGLNALMGQVPWPHLSIQLFTANLVQAIILPLQTAPWILLYYDLRIRKEAFDLQMLSESLGQPTAGGPAAT